jgi:DNA ligase-1
MTPTKPMKHNKGETYEPGMALSWPKYASVKLDGIRASGQQDTLITNSGKEIPNKELIAKFAPLVQGLDGELIYGEANHALVYNRTNSAVMTKNKPSADGVVFYVFDTLDTTSTFESRLEQQKLLAQHPSIVVLTQHLIHSLPELDSFYENCLDEGFEGVILRNPKALYKQGRSTLLSQDLLKLKPFKDSEAVVLEVQQAMTNLNPSKEDAHGYTVRSSHQANKVPLDMAGGFLAQDVHSGVVFTCSAGRSSHLERAKWWRYKDSLVGKVLRYRFLDVGTLVRPRLNGFTGWRDPCDFEVELPSL